jgi:hypothetical protein
VTWLLAGPFLGELGWELLQWQGWVRKQSLAHDRTVISCRRSSRYLYEDFADQFIDAEVAGTPDCWDLKQADVAAQQVAQHRLISFGGPSARYLRPTGPVSLENQVFIRFGKRVGPCYDVVVHARTRPYRGDHNWPAASWDQLAAALNAAGLRVAAVGTAAYCPKGCDDLRSNDLALTCNILASARMVIGPSSGPMHLASLCGTPHLVWTDKKVWSAVGCTNRGRYESVWNPLGTPCRILDEDGWQPPCAAVLSEVKQWLEELSHCPA